MATPPVHIGPFGATAFQRELGSWLLGEWLFRAAWNKDGTFAPDEGACLRSSDSREGRQRQHDAPPQHGVCGRRGTASAARRSGDRLVTVLGRRPVGFAHPRLSDCVVESFLDYSKVGKALEADAFIWCLGVSQAAVSREKYIEITLEYTLAAARAAWAQSPGLRFCFLSGPRGGSRRGGALALRKDQGSHRA